MLQHLFLIPLCPLLGCVLAFIIGKRIPKASGWIATTAAACSFLQVLGLFFGGTDFRGGAFIDERLFEWMASGSVQISFSLRMDALSMLMCLFVSGVGALIHLYAIGYMAEDASQPRFFAYLNLFLFSMLVLVLGANLPVLFIGWEGVGLCSYLLIGFWFSNEKFAAAGRKAFVVNRIGDAGLLLGTFLVMQYFGTVDFQGLAEAIRNGTPDGALLTLVSLCLFAGAVGKSAQIPLFVWLPDAMAGPTPVSALIHAATMVTAGVYLLARSAFIFEPAPQALFIVSLVALLTAFVAATIALVQNDIKKVLAYSTVSQLGFMFLAAGAGAYAVALFHVVTHAFFKACLFLGAGSVIHGCHHEQDMRQMGGLRKSMPITAATYGIATLAIAGVYPFAGYQSKHAIFGALEAVGNPYLAPWAEIFLLVAKGTAVLTAFYMTRSFILTFLGRYRGHAHPHESPVTMTLPLVVLAALSTVGGIWVGGHIFEFLGSFFPVHAEVHEAGLLSGIQGSWTALLGLGAAMLLYTKWSDVPGRIFSSCGAVSRILEGKYYFDEFYRAAIVRPLELIASMLARFVDQVLIDGSANGTAVMVNGAGTMLRLVQTGQIRHYAFMIFVGAALLISYCFLF